MKYNDFIHMSVPGDGSCFFHSIAQILTLEGDPIPLNQTMKQTKKNRITLSNKLRKQCVDWLENNLDYTIAQLGLTIRDEIEEAVRHCERTDCRDYKNVNQYLNYMRKNKSYAGQIEIYAMSYSLGRSIRVFIKNKDKFQSSGLGFMIGSNPDIMDDIHIYHNIGDTVEENQHHFEPLFPKVKAKKEIKKNKKKKQTRRKKLTKKKRTTKKVNRRNSRRKNIRKSTRRRKTKRNRK